MCMSVCINTKKSNSMRIFPELYLHFNPLFVVSLFYFYRAHLCVTLFLFPLYFVHTRTSYRIRQLRHFLVCTKFLKMIETAYCVRVTVYFLLFCLFSFLLRFFFVLFISVFAFVLFFFWLLCANRK